MFWLLALGCASTADTSGPPPGVTSDCFFDLSCEVPLAVAHRGAGLAGPENTLEALRLAAAMGVLGVEVDVRTAADGALVLLHDSTVDRTTDGEEEAGDLTLAQLKALTVDGQEAPGGVPSLREALDLAFELGLALDLDVKSVSATALAEALRGAGMTDRVFILTKSVEAGESLRAELPEVALMPNLSSPEELDAYLHLAPALVEVDYLDVAASAEVARAAGVKLFTHALGIEAMWVETGDTGWRYQALVDQGAQVIQTDFPAELTAALAR
ncbi:MAG: glycerophosphodiester phosphodiesterase family protein [Deltaproteobacteria bacterium]|nr:glycerophosphodiester phosphodiesterase family protein [Deltaproteobacteria bacterium]